MNCFLKKTFPHAKYLFLAAGLSGSLQAAPVIDSVNGSIVHGAQIVINGSNFGENASPTPLIWDDFEIGTTNSILNTSPQMGNWLLSHSPDPVYSTTRSVSGNKSAFMAYNPGNQWSSFVANPLPIADHFYQSFYFWFSSYGAGQIKLMQVHGNSGQGDFAPGFMFHTSSPGWWNNYISTVDGNNRESYQSISETDIPQAGKWHHYEMFLKRSSAGGIADGIVMVKIDGIVRYNQQNVVTRSNSAYNWDEISFMHGITNAGENIDAYVDDAYLNNTWARVELCESPRYADCQTKVVQPATSWLDGQISVKLVKGSFDNIDPLYLYVVDSNNVANSNGYPFCRICPKPPGENIAR